uniref:SPOR domain-containing protein n=1 Tax=Magnetococcus massalia (strain MO-1) TaxID=451514 RepID=A0A1S7LIF0_MAGMO|nr:Protein of unknown function [Candidatus Magnetococcus massalia]
MVLNHYPWTNFYRAILVWTDYTIHHQEARAFIRRHMGHVYALGEKSIQERSRQAGVDQEPAQLRARRTASAKQHRFALPDQRPAYQPTHQPDVERPMTAHTAHAAREPYTLYLGSYSSLATLDKLEQKLARAGLQSFSLSIKIKGRRYHRLYVGRYESQPLAKRALPRVRELTGIDVIVKQGVL